jgi:aryl-alcohol dehydrogenase-like predicted oxidoreductase
VRYRHLGASGLEVSEIGIGTNNFGGRLDAGQSADVVHSALDHGINLFDTANVYSHGVSEEYLGKALKGRREEAVIATKFGMKWADGPHGMGGSRKHIIDSIDGSLKRLGTDYIDLMQIHRQDPSTPIEETLSALDDAIKAGKVRYIGCSNYDAWRIADAMWTSERYGLARYVSCQPEYSMLVRDIEKEVLPACEQYGLGILPYFPLAHGFLTGKYRRGVPVPEGTRLALTPQAQDKRLTTDNFNILDQLESFVIARDKKVVELAFAWLLGHSAVSSVIAGASNPEQVGQNAAAAEWQLTGEEMTQLGNILDGEA